MEEKKHTHDGHRQRMKNKARLGGIEHWPYHEVLELLLMYALPRKDVNPLAHKLINHFGSFGAVLDAGVEQLKNFNGLGPDSALFLGLLPDIFARYTASKNVDAKILDNTIKCVNYFRENYRLKPVEEFYVFCLDAKKRLIATTSFSNGLVGSVEFGVAGIASVISSSNAKSFVVMHNHPGGKCRPSDADIIATKRLVDMAFSLGLKLDDHVIVTDSEYFSFLNNDYLEPLQKLARQSFNQTTAESSVLMRKILEENRRNNRE